MVFSPCNEINTQFLWPMRGTRLVDLWTFSAFDFNFDFIWTFFLCRDLVLFLASVTLVYVACCFWFCIWIWFRFWVLACQPSSLWYFRNYEWPGSWSAF